MKPFRWNPQKGEQLIAERGVSFEQMVVAIEAGGLLDVLAHLTRQVPQAACARGGLGRLCLLLPFVEEDEYFFLKTVIPSRKANA